MSWELFREFLVGEFMERMNAWVEGGPDQIRQLRDEEEKKLRRDFEHLRKRYAAMLGLPLTPESIPRWDEVQDVRLIRHAIIHNQGFYTEQYVKRPNVRPVPEDFFGITPRREQWVDSELIPLDLEYVHASLDLLLETAVQVRQRLGG